MQDIYTNAALVRNRASLSVVDGRESTVFAQQRLLLEQGIDPRWENWKRVILHLTSHLEWDPQPQANTETLKEHRAHEAVWREVFNRDFAASHPLPESYPRVVRASLSNLRFYVDDGWYLEELRGIMERGEIDCSHPHDLDPYFSLKVGGRLNVDALLSKTSVLRRVFETHEHGESDRDYIISHMW